MPLSEEIARFIGKTTTVSYEVEKGAIARFADAVGDPNPIYSDEDYASQSRFRSIISPPGFFGWPVKLRSAPPDEFSTMIESLTAAGYGRILDGGIEWEFFKPVRAGDRLTVETTIRNIMERSSKNGKAVFLFRYITYSNQEGELVATARQTTIHPQTK